MTTLPLPPEDYLTSLRSLTAGFAEVLRTADHTAPVPCCEPWTLADLGAHLGNVHRWAAKTVEAGEPQSQDFAAPVTGDLAAWYAEGAELLLAALAAARPEDPCWHFAGTPKVKAFWFRRQTHETAVHLVDAHRAAGTAFALDPAIAADGVDEVLTAILPRVTRWTSPPPLPEPLVLSATDTGDSWTLHPGAEGEPPALGPATEPAATVEATARDLLFLLWKRRPLAEVAPRISGTESVATGFLTAKLTP
ncbi:maleylpyruvate isomerase family mycothiol-dependent enzyme [Amycolatopsis sp. NPDC059027]|uniref:maleylpyruvate isomerase family mycothiol-dependent enzyme n=1 Tax=unclassified Amycolatopsis TaxID=2618356 RepID=UPI00366FF700